MPYSYGKIKIIFSLFIIVSATNNAELAYAKNIEICDTIGHVSEAIMSHRISGMPKKIMLEKLEVTYEKGNLSNGAYGVIKQLVDKAYHIEVTSSMYNNSKKYSSEFSRKYRKSCYDQRF